MGLSKSLFHGAAAGKNKDNVKTLPKSTRTNKESEDDDSDVVSQHSSSIISTIDPNSSTAMESLTDAQRESNY